VFDLLDIYYQSGWDAFRSAINTWVSVNDR